MAIFRVMTDGLAQSTLYSPFPATRTAPAISPLGTSRNSGAALSVARPSSRRCEQGQRTRRLRVPQFRHRRRLMRRAQDRSDPPPHPLATTEHSRFEPLGRYLTDMAESCPHHLFAADARGSQGKIAFNLGGVEIKTKRNHACRVADLILQAVTHNKRRHDELQRFMLTTDSVTVAVEVPIYLTPEDIAYFKDTLGFHIPIDTTATLTGHIDLVQIRNGVIHILDYKPKARLEKPIAQLMVYALALSRRTGLKLMSFCCSWFDEHQYYEFYPLHVVHSRRARR
jgi:hypothetical protein